MRDAGDQDVSAEPLFAAELSGEWPADGLERLGGCPVCGSTVAFQLYEGLRDRVFAAPGLWTIHECRDCGSGYLDPRPNRATIGRAYRSYYTHEAPDTDNPRPSRWQSARRALRNGYLNSRYGSRFAPAWKIGSPLVRLVPCAKQWADRRVRHLHASSTGHRILDVGCGNGSFLLDMRSAGWSIHGLDPDPAAVQAARAAGVPAEQGIFEESVFPHMYFTAVTLNHVIEHMYDPRKALRICHEILVPGGILWIATPNFASASHRVFRRHWRGLEPPRHLVLFTSEALERTVVDSGFEVIAWQRYCSATAMFEASAAIARQTVASRGPAARPKRLRLRAAAADARGFLEPRLGEEIILVAKKGLRGSRGS